MAHPGDLLPTVLAQKLDRNERICSLLSSVFFRSINPSFTHAIRRHPLSLWSLERSTHDEAPIAVFLERSGSPDSAIISQALKKDFTESGFIVAEIQDDHAKRENIFSKFTAGSDVFVVDLRLEDVVLVHARENSIHQRLVSSPSLVLVSPGLGPNAYRAEFLCHVNDPNAIVVSLPDALVSYGQGAKSLWLARCILKWTQGIKDTAEPTKKIHSRL